MIKDIPRAQGNHLTGMWKPSFLSNSSVPTVLDHMSGRHYAHFVKLVENWLKQHGHSYDLQAREGYFIENDCKYGLINIAQTCHRERVESWVTLIDNHFSRLFAQVAQSMEEAPSFKSLRNDLKIRIASPDLTVDPATLTLWPASQSFYTYLVIDQPEMTTSVRPEIMAEWKVDKDELWNIALENIWEQDKVEVELLADPEFNGLSVFSGDSVFTTSHAFMIERHFPAVPDLGFLMALPNREILIAHPIESPAAVNALARMADMATFMFQQGPGSITDQVFWYRHGLFEPLQMEITSKGIHLVGPGEFIYVVAQGHGFTP